MSLTREQCQAQAWLDMVWRGEYNDADRDSLAKLISEARAEMLEEAIRVASVAGSLGDDATQSAIVKSLCALGDAQGEQKSAG